MLGLQFISASTATEKNLCIWNYVGDVILKTFVFNHSYFGQRKYKSEEMWPFCDLDPRSRLWHWLTKICLINQEPLIHSLQNLEAISHSDVYYLINIGPWEIWMIF